MATVIPLTSLQRRILDRIVLCPDGFELLEDLLAAIGGDQREFVDALESLEGDGYLSITNLAGSLVVGCEDPLVAMSREMSAFPCATRAGQC